MFIKRPGYGRRTYALIDDQGKTVSDDRIDLVNMDLAAESVAIDELDARMKRIRDSFRPPKPALGAANLRLLTEYGMQIRANNPNLKSHYTLERRAIRAVEAIGSLPLTTATQMELLRVIKHVKHPGVRYHVIGGLNTLLRVARRDLRLRNTAPRGETSVTHLDIPDFLEMLKNIHDENFRIVMGALFATGCRWGELPQAEVKGNTVHISSQVRRNLMTDTTKNGKVRKAPVIPTLMPYLTRYTALSQEVKLHLRSTLHIPVLNASKANLGVLLHDLRHCYAVAWAKQGIPVSKIALWIGDTEAVCMKHYSRYQPTDEELEREVAGWKS